MLLLCHPHNPIGHVFDRSELEQLAEIAARHDLVGDQRRDPRRTRPPPASARAVCLVRFRRGGPDGDDHLVVEGLQPGRAPLGDDACRADGAPDRHGQACPLTTSAHRTCWRSRPRSAAWAEGDGWQRAVSAQLDANRRLLAELLAEHLPGVDYVVPDATYLAWLDLRPLDWAATRTSGCGPVGSS